MGGTMQSKSPTPACTAVEFNIKTVDLSMASLININFI